MNRKQLARMHKRKKEMRRYRPDAYDTAHLRGKIKDVDDPVQEIKSNKQIVIDWWEKIKYLFKTKA